MLPMHLLYSEDTAGHPAVLMQILEAEAQLQPSAAAFAPHVPHRSTTVCTLPALTPPAARLAQRNGPPTYATGRGHVLCPCCGCVISPDDPVLACFEPIPPQQRNNHIRRLEVEVTVSNSLASGEDSREAKDAEAGAAWRKLVIPDELVVVLPGGSLSDDIGHSCKYLEVWHRILTAKLNSTVSSGQLHAFIARSCYPARVCLHTRSIVPPSFVWLKHSGHTKLNSLRSNEPRFGLRS